MQKVTDFTYVYQGLEGQIRVYGLASGMTVAISTETLNNTPRASITGAAASLATEIRLMYVEPGGVMLWIEHHPGNAETFYWVQLRWDGRAYTEPERRPLSRVQVEELIGEAVAQGSER